MIPLRLELRGFTCFRRPTTVDFSDLEADLFAISGPTGSGKSTLLDAMTYALYGQTARLGGTGVRDALVSPGSDEMAVQLTFEADGGTYRVTRAVTVRPSGPATDIRLEHLQPDGSFRSMPEGEKIRSANDALERIVGLDYSGFSRAVLLPQGAFDEFLRGDAGERRRLLTRLLGLDTVERVGRRAHEAAKEAERTVAGIDTRLAEDYAGATPGRRREVADELARHRSEIDELDATLATLDEELTVLERRKAADAARRNATEALAGLEAAREEQEARVRRLQAAERAEAVAPHLDAEAKAGTRRSALAERAASLAEAKAAAAEAADAARARRSEARTAREAREDAIGRELEALAAVRPRAERLERIRSGLEGTPSTTELAAAADGSPFDDEAFAALEAGLRTLPALRRSHAAVGRADRRVETAEVAYEAATEALDTAASTLAETLEQGKRARARLDEAEAALLAAQREDHAAALRADLAAGDPCPVCGQPVGDLPHGEGPDLEAARAVVARRTDEREALATRYQQAQKSHASAEAARASAATERDRAREAAHEARSAWAEAVDAFPAPLDPDLRAAGREGLGADDRRSETPDGAGAATDIDPASLDPDAVETWLRRRHRAQLARLAAAVHAATGGREPAARRRELEEERTALRAAAEAANEALAAAERRLESATAEAASMRERLDDADADVASARDAVDAALARSGFADREAVTAARLEPGERTALEAARDAWEARRSEAERSRNEAEATLDGASYDADAHEAARRRRTELRTTRDTAQAKRGSLEGELGRIDEQLEKAKELREERRAAEGRLDLYRTLHTDLRSNNFPAYLMARVQQRLAAHASSIVRGVTDGRYDLRLVDDEFHVRDAWAGGESRSARTLSGGETFIASLALALALSDTLAGSRRLGALFLDEGFGTLDREALDAVAGVLESLASDGRIVGIITHVTELTERMPARLRVEKGPEGSTVAWDV